MVAAIHHVEITIMKTDAMGVREANSLVADSTPQYRLHAFRFRVITPNGRVLVISDVKAVAIIHANVLG